MRMSWLLLIMFLSMHGSTIKLKNESQALALADYVENWAELRRNTFSSANGGAL